MESNKYRKNTLCRLLLMVKVVLKTHSCTRYRSHLVYLGGDPRGCPWSDGVGVAGTGKGRKPTKGALLGRLPLWAAEAHSFPLGTSRRRCQTALAPPCPEKWVIYALFYCH